MKDAEAGAVLALNAGSSSLKFGLYAMDDAVPTLLVRGEIEDVGGQGAFKASDAFGSSLAQEDWREQGQDEGGMLARMLAWIDAYLDGRPLRSVGHRIVHGGRDFQHPTRLTADVLAKLETLAPLAPLHQPRSLAPAKMIAETRRNLPQVGCFDTAFHAAIEPPANRYGIPKWLEEEGVRRYGFHGLSYQHVADEIPEILPGCRRVVAAHLGNGASLCALLDGRSVDTTMGFSVLDGLVMGTRPGTLDPGIILYLLKQRGMSADAIEDLLYHQSGLFGVSGVSADMRVLERSGEPSAWEAIELFGFRISREIAAMVNTLQGLDGLVFTGGIGAHSALIRRLVCERLAWLDVSLDHAANEAGLAKLDTPSSKVAIRTIPADEEVVIAAQTLQALPEVDR